MLVTGEAGGLGGGPVGTPAGRVGTPVGPAQLEKKGWATGLPTAVVTSLAAAAARSANLTTRALLGGTCRVEHCFRQGLNSAEPAWHANSVWSILGAGRAPCATAHQNLTSVRQCSIADGAAQSAPCQLPVHATASSHSRGLLTPSVPRSVLQGPTLCTWTDHRTRPAPARGFCAPRKTSRARTCRPLSWVMACWACSWLA